MKKLITIICAFAFMLISTSSFAQVPQKFNYQGIARDAKGNPIGKQQMALKISVLPTSDASVAEYEETQIVTTNEFGLYTLQIGNGTAIAGDMKTVKWETGNKYIKVAIDQKGGNNFVDIGTSQLLSVPYAIYADKAGVARESNEEIKKTRGLDKFIEMTSGSATDQTSMIYQNARPPVSLGSLPAYQLGYNQLGIGTTSPIASAMVHIQSPGLGIQPIVFEGLSFTGVHGLFREGGNNRGYFGSYVGSHRAPAYTGTATIPSPVGTQDEDFDVGTSQSNSLGKFHLTTRTIPRITILPSSGQGRVGINNTSPNTGALPSGISLNPNLILDVNGRVQIRGGSPANNYVLTATDNNGYAIWKDPATLTGVISGSGTLNYIPKWTPTGTALGNSGFLEDATGLLYNTTAQFSTYSGTTWNSGITINNPQEAMTITNSSATMNYLNLGSNGVRKGLMMTTPTSFSNTSSAPHAGYSYLIRNEVTNSTHLGNDKSGLHIQDDGTIRNGDFFATPTLNAALNISADNMNTLTPPNQAGYFNSSSNTLMNDGILKAEYTGTNTTNNNVAIYGKSQASATSDQGIGVAGQGGNIGVQGYVSHAGVTTGSSYGAYGLVQTDNTSIGVAAIGLDNGATTGTKYGVSSIGGGGTTNYGVSGAGFVYSNPASTNYGLFGSNKGFFGGITDGRGYGVYGEGKQTGVYGEAIEANVIQSELAVTFGGLLVEAVGVHGKAKQSMPSTSSAITISTGVLGTAVEAINPTQDHFGLMGEAKNAQSGNFGVYAYADGTTNNAASNYGIYAEAKGAPISGSNNYGIYASAPVATNSWAGYFNGKVNITNELVALTQAAATKMFKIDHPLDPKNKILSHSVIESPDMMNMYNGNITTDANGKALVTMPNYFEALNQDFRYQLTVIDNSQFAQARISKKINANQFEIMTDKPNVEISWQVTGIRHDAVAEKFRIKVEEDKVGTEVGKYLWPQAFEDGKAQIEEQKNPLGNLKKNTNQKPAINIDDNKKAEQKQREEMLNDMLEYSKKTKK